MSDYNRENHHGEHHERIEELKEERDEWYAAAHAAEQAMDAVIEERDRLREELADCQAGWEAQGWLEENAKLREGRRQALVAHAVEKQAKHALEAENIGLREKLEAQTKDFGRIVLALNEDIARLRGELGQEHLGSFQDGVEEGLAYHDAEVDRLREENGQYRQDAEDKNAGLREALEKAERFLDPPLDQGDFRALKVIRNALKETT